MVRDYLLFYGYADTLAAFDGAAGLDPGNDLSQDRRAGGPPPAQESPRLGAPRRCGPGASPLFLSRVPFSAPALQELFL